MKADNGLSDFKQHPNLVKAWCRAGNKWFATHKDSKSAKKFGDVYRLFVQDVFFHSYKDFIRETTSEFTGVVENVDCKKFLEDYFNIKFSD